MAWGRPEKGEWTKHLVTRISEKWLPASLRVTVSVPALPGHPIYALPVHSTRARSQKPVPWVRYTIQ